MRAPATGAMVEECDRWQQAILYGRIARECFAEAQKRFGATAKA